MSNISTPFTKDQLIPQEERLEITRTSRDLIIGIPKENQEIERRICLTPDAVAAITAHGHKIIIEKGAGLGSNFTDQDYINAGGEITSDKNKVFSCPMVLKVAPPSLDEIDLLKPNATLFSGLQLKTRSKAYFKKLASKKITALAYEFITDESGRFTAVNALREISGIASVLIASELLATGSNRTGQLFGNITGVPPVDVVILGAGVIGEFAARTAQGLGATIKVFDNSITNLRRIQDRVGNHIYTSTIQPKYLAKALRRCDVAIGALSGEDRTPVVVSQPMVENMKSGAVIIDTSIDMGGCFETSELTTHSSPTYDKFNITHYCVPNLPSRYSRTATISLSNIFTPYLLNIGGDGGIEHTLRTDKGLKCSVYLYHGILTNKSVGQWYDLPYSDVNLLIF
ncbi:alanine dehydrogenase [Nonlabens sp. MIC269]|uniref:alanine dehydrogenase n=1 Tax=Nonlabens sp. MIC269 TaxID=1476901 RepID=UPI000720BB1F|nr:alanine dehydrogenase [Nonlabens sp. MIC269]ALM19763.1 alanine dehydrogenase [Nonlabens sp. MIC269]ALM22068.1 alanine dehydrogenase [Nonlabens sp. MIC269]